MQLRPGETITDEARFIQANTSRSEHCKGRAREAYQHNLDTYYQLKKKQEKCNILQPKQHEKARN